MDALSTLKDEHSVIAVEMYHMDRLLAFLESSGPIRGARILRELVESSGRMHENLQLHVNKEERGLFPVLQSRLGKDRELLEVMRREHAELLVSLKSLRSEIDRMTRSRYQENLDPSIEASGAQRRLIGSPIERGENSVLAGRTSTLKAGPEEDRLQLPSHD